MFDHPDHKKELGEGEGNINLLPKEMRIKVDHQAKPKVDTDDIHLPPKVNLPKKSNPSLPKTSAPHKISSKKPSLFKKIGLFFHSSHKAVPPPSILAVNEVAQNTTAPNFVPPIPTPIKPSVVPPVSPVTKPAPPKVKITGSSLGEGAKAKNDLEVNLLPPRPKRLTDTQIIFSYFFILIISILIIFTPYIFYRSKNKSYNADNKIIGGQLDLVAQKTKELQTQIQEYSALAMQLKNINTIFNNHLYWSRFFPTLENHTTGNVYFTSLKVDGKDKVSLGGSALNLRSIAEELIVFENSQVYLNSKLQSLVFVEPKNPGDPAINFSLDFSIPHSLILSSDIISVSVQK